MVSYSSDQFYKKLNLFYSKIKRFNKDVIYDYSYISNVEKQIKSINTEWPYDNVYKESTFNIAIFVRKTGTHLFDFQKDNMSFFETFKKNNDKVMIIQKCLVGRYENPVYFIKTFILKTN